MNLNQICRNPFLIKAFPNGFERFCVIDIELSFHKLFLHENRGFFSLVVLDKPAVSVLKWGKYGEDYDAVEFDFTFCMCHKIKIDNFNKNKFEMCCCEVKKIYINEKEMFEIFFFGEKWQIVLLVCGVSFQKSKAVKFGEKYEHFRYCSKRVAL